MSATNTLRLDAEREARIDDLQKRYPRRDATLLHVLWEIQWQHGWISQEWMQYAAERCGVPASKVLGVVSFYTMYRQHPVGKYHVEVCRNITCHMLGARALIDQVKAKLGVGEHEVSACGRWSFEEVECMGACSWAPMMAVNGAYHENLTPAKVDQVLDGLRS